MIRSYLIKTRSLIGGGEKKTKNLMEGTRLSGWRVRTPIEAGGMAGGKENLIENGILKLSNPQLLCLGPGVLHITYCTVVVI